VTQPYTDHPMPWGLLHLDADQMQIRVFHIFVRMEVAVGPTTPPVVARHTWELAEHPAAHSRGHHSAQSGSNSGYTRRMASGAYALECGRQRRFWYHAPLFSHSQRAVCDDLALRSARRVRGAHGDSVGSSSVTLDHLRQLRTSASVELHAVHELRRLGWMTLSALCYRHEER
jgi:hypothetical protein